MRDYIPEASETIDLTSDDHTMVRKVHGIRVEAAGTLYATLIGEGSISEVSRAYTVVVGDTLLGRFASVQRATSDAAFQNATTLVGLVLPKDQ